MISDLPSNTRKLMDSERRFRLLVEGVVDYAIYMLAPSGIITNWNAGAKRIKGYDADEIIGRHFSIFYTPEDRASGLPQQALKTALHEGKYEAEGWRVRKDGSRFLASVVIDPIHEHGTLVGFAKITRDVTEREMAQRALKQSERQFRLLVSAVTDYAIYMLDPKGNVSSWNSGGQRIKGYAPEEIIGQHFSLFYTESDRAAGRPARALSIAENEGRYMEDGWRVRKDGSYFWAGVVIDPIRDDEGRLIGFAKITRDITERREAQIAMDRMQRQLAESQKLDALGQLTGGVAHDFNNLLMVIAGHTPALKEAAAGNARALRAARAIEMAAQKGATLTRHLLTFSRRQQVNPEAINVSERVDALREVLSVGLGSGVDLHFNAAPDLWPVSADINEFELSMVNLVVNARDAMPDGGWINIAASNTRLDGNENVPAGDYVAISVSDTGIGIPPDVMSKVFDPFFTTKPVGKGTGLGLSQVHGFVHQAGGTVKIESEINHGTTITLFLPRFANTVPEPTTRDPAESGVAASRTILLVEDNPDVASASTALLEQLGYTVRWARNADAALIEIEREGIDVVFSDIVMPGHMDGLGLAQAIMVRRPRMPILLTTGYSEAANKAQLGLPILRKPFQLHELGNALAGLAR